MGLGSGIRDPGSGIRKKPIPDLGSQIRNTAGYSTPGRIFPVPAVGKEGGHHCSQSQDSLCIQGRYRTLSQSGGRYCRPGRIFPVPAVGRRGGHHPGQSQDSLHVQGRYCTLFTFWVGTAHLVGFSLCQQWREEGDITVDSHKTPFTFKVGTALFSHSGYRYPAPGRIFTVPAVGRRGGDHHGQSQDSLHLQGTVGTGLFSHSWYRYPAPGRIFPVPTVRRKGGHHRGSHKISFTFKVILTVMSHHRQQIMILLFHESPKVVYRTIK
jgi:hypothetical protein